MQLDMGLKRTVEHLTYKKDKYIWKDYCYCFKES